MTPVDLSNQDGQGMVASGVSWRGWGWWSGEWGWLGVGLVGSGVERVRFCFFFS